VDNVDKSSIFDQKLFEEDVKQFGLEFALKNQERLWEEYEERMLPFLITSG
jgi:hypothetical protein